jgi:transcriptional regulator with XRE-family HTH domain
MTHTDDLNRTTIGELLRIHRWEDAYPKIYSTNLPERFTQKFLSERTGLSIPTIRNLENGKGTIDSLKRVMDELELFLVIYDPLNKEEEEMIFTKSGSGKPYLRIGTQIKLLRNQKGYSQRKLAEIVGVSHPTINSIERHEKGRLSILESITKKLSVHANVIPFGDMRSDFGTY